MQNKLAIDNEHTRESQDVYAFQKAVIEERNYQKKRLADGSPSGLNDIDDHFNKPNDWAAYIAHSAMKWFPGGFWPYGGSRQKVAVLDQFKRSMVVVAALAMAAHMWADRRLEEEKDEG